MRAGGASASSDSIGDILRRWRAQRRLSQMDLALDAEVSSRHLSFVESGRSAASRELLNRLAEHLRMPLRARNRLLLAGGYAPEYGEAPLSAPELDQARATVLSVLSAQEPFPALAVDRHWNILHANLGLTRLLAGVDAALLAPPANALRIGLHPQGLALQIENLGEWRAHLLERLRRQADDTLDPEIEALLDELKTYPSPPHGPAIANFAAGAVAVPLVLRASAERPRLRLLSTTTLFGTATQVTLAELAVECFYPADPATRDYLLRQAPS